LELAVEISPGRWVDLLLQAKRLYTGSSTYEQWKASQVDDLRAWADRRGSTPGMLLYNARVDPFSKGNSVIQGACSAGMVRMSLQKLPESPLPRPIAPLGITLVALPRLPIVLPVGLQGDALDAATVNEFASPWECMICDHWPVKGNLGHGGISPAEVRDSMPDWAVELAQLVGARGDDDIVVAPDTGEDSDERPEFSVVLPFSDPTSELEPSSGE